MLILSRRRGETIHIGEDIVIEIRHVRADLVRVGISAPEHVKLLRGELFDIEDDDG